MAAWDEQIPGQGNQTLDPLSTFLNMIGTVGAARGGKRARVGLPGGANVQANMPVEPVLILVVIRGCPRLRCPRRWNREMLKHSSSWMPFLRMAEFRPTGT